MRGAREPIRGRLVQRLLDRRIDLLGDGVANAPNGGDRSGEALGDDGLRARARVGRLTREHFVEHTPQRVDVGAVIDGSGAGGLLGTHVGRRAHGHPGLRQFFAARHRHRPRDAKVRDDGAPAGEQDVLRLDIAVHDVFAVGVPERVGNFLCDLDGVVERQLRFAIEPITEGFALDHRHDVIKETFRLTGIEDGQDVGMFELGGQFHFPYEPIDAHRGGQLGSQHLDGNLALELEIRGEIDDGHTAGAQLALDGVTVGQGGFEMFEAVGHGTLAWWLRTYNTTVRVGRLELRKLPKSQRLLFPTPSRLDSHDGIDLRVNQVSPTTWRSREPFQKTLANVADVESGDLS